MSKKNKNHRTQASKRRHAATKRSEAAKKRQKQRRKLEKRYPRLNDTPVFTPDNLDDAPTILEIAHTYDVNDLGKNGEAGMMALSLAQYIGSVRSRLLDGEVPKANVFIQLAFSHFSPAQFRARPTLHGNGGTNVLLMNLALLNEDQMIEFVLDTEKSAREIVAQLNERNEDIIRSVHITIDETDHEVDPSASFGFDGGADAVDYRVESEVNVPL